MKPNEMISNNEIIKVVSKQILIAKLFLKITVKQFFFFTFKITL